MFKVKFKNNLLHSSIVDVYKRQVVDGAFTSVEEINALASLPNKEGMLSMLLSVLQAPVRNVAYAVKAVAESKEDGAA